MFELKVPQIGESITSAFIGTWLKKPGDAVAEGEAVVELDSDKATLEVPSPVSGVLREQKGGEGDEIDIGAVIAVIEQGAVAADGGATDSAPAQAAPAATTEDPADDAGARGATPSDKGPQTGPAARQAAAQSGVDISQVSGTGVRGRVLSGDVKAAATPRTASSPAAAPAATPVDTGALEERVPMTPLRRTIARRLVEAQHTAAMLTTFNEVDLHNVMALRQRYQDRFVKKYGIKLGFMSFFVKATIEALKAFPAVNAEIDDSDPDRPAVVYKRYYNIGVAVSTNRGLMVPVLRDADRLSFAETELAIGELAGRGRDGKLTLDDFKGGTFTISNGGVFGSLMSTPILNRPQVGILGMHTIQERPVGVDGQIVLRPMMYLAMSYDHRIIDGREAVSFLKRIKELVEDPERILLEV
ncbi:MAG: 2-oxoglutarate dehydrogenase complex dihydrolipoyllysine-residue succinyltransferase [Alphaproteobacteria bacterium]|nr:2-oxoglutarate dehydrogenase complex dihydrolipoyllysine-residue succinyltransferase [Alphaproteobacteria bacterium]